jgi:hypothetical protein
MTKALPYKPAREEVLLAFAKAIDAWTEVERELLLYLGIFLCQPNINKTGAVFLAVNSFQSQCRMVEAAAKIALPETGPIAGFLALTEKARKLSTQRNRLVHGRWREVTVHTDGAPSHRIVFRDYSVEFGGNTPTSDQQVRILRDKKVWFYLEDIVQAERDFRQLARDMFLYQAQVIGEVRP